MNNRPSGSRPALPYEQRLAKKLASVRVAGPADREEILRLFWGAHAENGFFQPDLDKVNWWLTRILEPESLNPLDTGPRGVIGVIGEPKRLEAVVFLIIGGFWYTSARHLEEFTVFVDPPYRRNGHHKALVNWMMEQARVTGLPLMTGVMSTHRTEAKVRLYESMLPKAGAFFCFNPITAASSAVRMMH